ncbi:hypothetical protein RhiirC2_418334 [Rhizophagus irregularis]|uniref:Uncharacterized protein n=1 Tax=Rhizophagus irregularis TaxID=588596 RepID=A0A2N1M5J1_9GLOM|nr:hypothetical protein RhiirC2_418334 [Rhizophagus irregularis]
MSESKEYEYFDRKSSKWNIIGFLNECDLEPFQRKIDCYLKCLDTIFESEHGMRKETAKNLLDNYKLEPKTDRRRARHWDQERSRKQVHINQPIVATVHGNGNMTNIGDDNSGTIVSSKRGKRDKEEEDERNQTKRVRFHEEKSPLKKKSKSGKRVSI